MASGITSVCRTLLQTPFISKNPLTESFHRARCAAKQTVSRRRATFASQSVSCRAFKGQLNQPAYDLVLANRRDTQNSKAGVGDQSGACRTILEPAASWARRT